MARAIKLIRLIPHVLSIITISYYISQMPDPTRYTIKKIIRYHQDMKHILLWTDIPGFDKEGQNIFLDKHCLIMNCYVTQNRSLFRDLRYFDAVLFNAKEVSQGNMELPAVRSALQKYIFVANESSDNYPVCDSAFDDFFNWTWTYKTDSTMPYKFFAVKNFDDQDLGAGFPQRTKTEKLDKFEKNQFNGKSKAAAIFLDKCESKSRREDFIIELEKHLAQYKLTVDVFGKCGPKQCKRKTMAPCFWKLRKNYYFYLALEDSIAEDYITDQILYGYKYNAVPIVFGGANYPHFLPKNSYINAMEMTQENLAKTINDIIQNKSRYYEYFEWKNHYVITDYPVLDPCVLCRNLNYVPWFNLKVSYFLFRQWWNSDYKQRCNKNWRMNLF